MSRFDTNVSDTGETPKTLETVSRLDTNVSDTGEAPETFVTLVTLETAGSMNYCRKTSVYALCREKATSTRLYLEH